jgi:hypothetical protein
MDKKFERSEQDKPLGEFGDTKKPKDPNPRPKTVTEKTTKKKKR